MPEVHRPVTSGRHEIPGPSEYDRKYVALNQVIKYGDRYYACYHGSPGEPRPALWSSNLAASTDLIHWKKYLGNPLRPRSPWLSPSPWRRRAALARPTR